MIPSIVKNVSTLIFRIGSSSSAGRPWPDLAGLARLQVGDERPQRGSTDEFTHRPGREAAKPRTFCAHVGRSRKTCINLLAPPPLRAERRLQRVATSRLRPFDVDDAPRSRTEL